MKCLKSLGLIALLTTFAVPSYAAQKEEPFVTSNETKTVLRVLEENPDALMNILQRESGVLLDIVQKESQERRIKASREQWKKDLSIPKKMNLLGRPSTGKENAPVTVVVYSNFTCHYCKKLKPVLDALLQEYPEKVRIVYKSFHDPRNPLSMKSAEYFYSINEINPLKAWTFLNIVLKNDEAFKKDQERFLWNIAKSLDVKPSDLMENIIEKNNVRQKLEEDLVDAKNNAVNGTPCIFVDNIVIQGYRPLSELKDAVDLALNAKKNK